MLGKKMKQFVYTVLDQSEGAFTLLSMLVIIAILFTTLPLLAYLISSTTYTTSYDEISTRQFFNFLSDELMLATDYSVSKNKLVLDDLDGNKISFEKYNNVILRKVDGEGHDIYLRDVQTIGFIDLLYGIQVEVTSLEGETYEKAIIHYE